MAAVVLCQSPVYASGFFPFEGPILNFIFGNMPTQVTAQLWPIASATAITGATVFINGSAAKPSTLTAIAGTQGKTLTFNLGGDADETPGTINTVFIDVDDNAPDFTSVALRYYRAAGAVPTTLPPGTTTPPVTTAPPTTAPPTTAPPTTTLPPGTTTTTTRPPTTPPVTTSPPAKRPPPHHPGGKHPGEKRRKKGRKK